MVVVTTRVHLDLALALNDPVPQSDEEFDLNEDVSPDPHFRALYHAANSVILNITTFVMYSSLLS